MTNEYVPRAREHAAAWKATAELPDEARADAPYISRRRHRAGPLLVLPSRYRDAWFAADGPVRTDVVPYEDLFVEPFYQLLRQQLLARAMERVHERGADVVRVVHVSPPGNTALRASLNRPSHFAVADDVFDVWRRIVRQPDRFVCVDSAVFGDAAVSGAYVARYGHD